MSKLFARGACLALLLSAPALCQVIDRIVPEVFKPGDVVSVRGSGLGALTQVPFTATVGGFVGTWTEMADVALASATELLVKAPEFGNFVPPFAGSSPFGIVGDFALGTVPGYFTQGTFGAVTTAGAGSPAAGIPNNDVVIAFELSKGGPDPGNASFVLKVENAPSGAAAFVLAGRPAATPAPFAGGLLAVDLALPFVAIGPFTVNTKGEGFAALPLPAGLGVTVALQWIMKVPGTNQKLISNALFTAL